MVVIRLARSGRKNLPFFRIVVADRRRSRDGKFIKKIGYFNPLCKNKIFFNVNCFTYWLSKGAISSKRVLYLFKKYKNICKLK